MRATPRTSTTRTRRRRRTPSRSGKDALASLQDMLYAQDRWSVLLIFQAMDAAGKDGTIKHVMSGVNPQGCQVYSFKAPSHEELDHDCLWRCMRALPERGRIGIFNRSYYEEVLVVRVHPEILAAQKIPPTLVGKKVWDERYQDIRGVRAAPGAQRHADPQVLPQRLERRAEEALPRADRPAGEELEVLRRRRRRSARTGTTTWPPTRTLIRETAAPHAPWYVVPADNKWFTRVVVAAAIIDALASLDLHYPKVTQAQLAELAAARKLLLAEKK